MEDLARAIATGGTFGLILGLTVALWWFATGRGRVGAIVDAEKKEEAQRRDQREAQLTKERDEALALSKVYADQFERALDIIEGKAK